MHPHDEQLLQEMDELSSFALSCAIESGLTNLLFIDSVLAKCVINTRVISNGNLEMSEYENDEIVKQNLL